ncbi:MAG: DUF1272 domain-containing protein [Bacteroidetes bacterium]|nr:DUF1272 domain-containing protein [Bacteroidota bacterium]
MKMKINCEHCNVALQPEGLAYVCSYECTYCSNCATQFQHICPNCSGELVRRPKRLPKDKTR